MKKKLSMLMLVILLMLTGCATENTNYGGTNSSNEVSSETINNMTVSFIDVGQADCILITSGKESMLIDAGNNEDADLIIDYLNNQEVTSLKYVIGTHPHEDHIGSLDEIISYYDVKSVIMPDAVTTTVTYENVLDAIEKKGLTIDVPEVGTVYSIGDASFTVITPHKEYSNLNDYSIGIKLVNGNDSFVFCGDCEASAEQEIINTGIDISADVLKVNHHGSSTSSSSKFINAVNPTYAVIMCGIDNEYGHPHSETLDVLSGVNIFRTDEQGTIVAKSTGNGITFNTIPSAMESNTEENNSEESNNAIDNPTISSIIIGNINSKKYHIESCSSLPSEKNQVIFSTEEEAVSAGYSPCGNCIGN